ncbi:protein of unknown function [Thermococcus nautili]|nr:protein of unknown function [Thermococcus nautili]
MMRIPFTGLWVISLRMLGAGKEMTE